MGAIDVVWLVEDAMRELALFAGVGLLLGGLDDLVVDLIWLARQSYRRLWVYSRHPRASAATLPPPARPARIAVMVGAWHEERIVGNMLRAACRRWGAADFRIYVGLYPNDPATFVEVFQAAADDPRIVPVPGLVDGPTTKAEALNRCWLAMRDEEEAEGWRAAAVLLHDAEDAVHADELTVVASLIERFALVQLPVLPLPEPRSKWVAGHYMDEFAEAHGKQLVVREWLGAAVPLAGTGCAIARDALDDVVAANGGLPFEAHSLTEDYELGLRLKSFGGRPAFVRIRAARGGELVAVRAHFPETVEAAVRQKCRWLRGIAFEGWDRLGWGSGLAENWMRLRDRRAPLAALVLAAAYLLLALLPVDVALRLGAGLPLSGAWPDSPLVLATTALLGWRAAMRAIAVTRLYGVAEGLRSVPRLVVGNVIAMMAAQRALVCYLRPDDGSAARWDKTAHRFPDAVAAE